MRKSRKLKLTKKQKIRKNKTRKLRRIKKIRGGLPLDDIINDFIKQCKNKSIKYDSFDSSAYKSILPQNMGEEIFNKAYPEYPVEEQERYKNMLRNNFIKKFCKTENTYPAKVGTNNRVPYDLDTLAPVPTEVKSNPKVKPNPRILEPISLGTSTTQSEKPVEQKSTLLSYFTSKPKCKRKCEIVHKDWRINPACSGFSGPDRNKMIEVPCQ
jgi:hypothetical protein